MEGKRKSADLQNTTINISHQSSLSPKTDATPTANYARKVYIQLNKEFRVSRNIRLMWYLDHLNSQVSVPNDNDSTIETTGLQVLSIIDSDMTSSDQPCMMTTDTRLAFISGGYKFVFALDLSASVLRVDTFQQCVMVETILLNLEECLMSLIQPFIVPGTSCPQQPSIFITLFVQWRGTTSVEGHQKVIIQGCRLSESSVQHIMSLAKKVIYSIKYSAEGMTSAGMARPQQYDNTLITILDTALLALQLLPPNTSSGIIVFTDGVIGEPIPVLLDNILGKCQTLTTACSFVHVNPSSFPLCNFGCVSHTELMQFVAQSTKGKYINTFQAPSNQSHCLNMYQESLMLWTFQADENDNYVTVQDHTAWRSSHRSTCSVFELRNLSPEQRDVPALMSRKHGEKSLRVSLPTVVGSRLREGYSIKQVLFPKNMIEVRLELCWWKNHTTVEYRVSAPWPLSKKSCKVEVHIAGTYEFLFDISRGKLVERWTRSRKQVTQRFVIFIRNLQQADHMLQNLANFNSDPVYYFVSDVLSQAQSLFYLPPNSSEFVLSAQAETTPSLFSSYWKPVLSLDVSIWQKWLHVHYIQVILKHDNPLPKHLHSSSSDGRYHTVQCQVAFAQLLTLLREWCSFVLLEGHTYVKLIFEGSSTEKPMYFFIVRVWNKSPAVILKVAFFLGVPGEVRKQQVDELRERVSALATGGTASVKRVRHSSSRISPGIRTKHLSDKRTSVVLMSKPLDKLLVQYNQLPRDYLHISQSTNHLVQNHQPISDNTKKLHELQCYLARKRYVWSVTSNTDTPVAMEIAESLPNLLMKLRMAEGYNIANSTSGVLTLAREFPLASMFNISDDNKQESLRNCLVQCVLFPPKIRATDTSVSTNESDEDEDEISTKPKEILLAMEIWIEPQHGMITQPQFSSRFSSSSTGSSSSMKLMHADLTPGIPYYEGLDCYQISPAIAQKDTSWISTVITLEHLQLMCKNDNMATTFPQLADNYTSMKESAQDVSFSNDTLISDDLSDKGSVSKLEEQLFDQVQGFELDSNITVFPCMFNFIGLLDQSPRTKLHFMTLQQTLKDEQGPNEVLFSHLHHSIERICDCEVNLSSSDQFGINKHILATENSGNAENVEANKSELSRRWCCYLKVGDSGQVLIILLPASYADFRNIFGVCVDSKPQERSNSSSAVTITDHENLLTPSFTIPGSPAGTDEKHIDGGNSHRIARRISIKRQASMTETYRLEDKAAEKSLQQRTFTVYVYNCSMGMLVSSALQSVHTQRKIKWQESVQDHRFYTLDNGENGVVYQTLSPKDFSEMGRSFQASHSIDASDEVFPLVSRENDQVNNICMQIVDGYRQSFVSGVFEGVQTDSEQIVSTEDLQIATDSICQEFVEEIDITDFMLLNSPQVAEFKSQHLTPSSLSGFKQQIGDTELDDIEDICKDAVLPKKEPQPPPESVPLIRESSPVNLHPSDSVNSVESSQDGQNVDNYITIPHQKESAFTSVRQRHRISECERHLSESTSSDDEAFESRKKKAQSHQRERQITHTLPVKQVDLKKNMSGTMQSGWKNLPSIPLSVLGKSHSRHLSGSNEQLEKYFNNVLKKYCRAIPTLPDVYYAVNNSGQAFTSATHTSISQYDSENDAVQFTHKHGVSDVSDAVYDHPGSIHADDNASISSASGTYSAPLFMCMTCTVRDKSSGNHGTLPVIALPTNLGTVLDSFENPCENVNLSDLKITLDLIWLFLPTHSDSNGATKLDVAHRLSYSEHDISISDFPPECLPCVAGVKKSISWLLEDEIMSSLRTCEPINTLTLEKATHHIEKKKSSNCIMETVPLQFILGLDSSKALFSIEFERFRFEKYKLKKEDQYYYLSIERENTSFLPIRFSTEPIDFKLVEPDTGTVTPQPTASNQMWSTPIVSQCSASSSKADSNSQMKHGRQSCVSLYQQDQLPPAENKIHKAASSVELSNCILPARRSSSVTNVHVESSWKYGKPNRLGQNKPTPLQINSSTSNFHQPLHASLSGGKEHHSPLFIGKSNAMSMPGTPANNNDNIYFNFLSGTNKLGIDNASFPGPTTSSRDPIFSPVSDSSPRQYSQNSLIASGYEGEVSDTEDEEYYQQMIQEANSQLPNFWLIVQIKDDCANIYFHRRGSARVLKSLKMEQNNVMQIIKANLHSACRAVNQILLLKKLHESHLCHQLLVEEPAEDIWKRDEYSSVYQTTTIDEYGTSEEVTDHGEYLAANMNFRPGYFECRCVLQQFIFLHHRITGTVSGSSLTSKAPSAMTTIRSFLKNFAVVNQKNMFVFQMEDNTIFYCRMEMEVRKSEPSSRRSSLVTSSAGLDTTPVSVRESKESLVSVADNDPKLCIQWYGVHELTSQHLEELTKVKESIERKMDEAVLEYITLMLTRNKMFKLSPADVSLIQPRLDCQSSQPTPKQPDNILLFGVCGSLVNELTNASFLYYLDQNLLQFVIMPRYTDPNNTAGFFLSYQLQGHSGSSILNDISGNKAPGSIYLYNGSTEKGRMGQGIACIFLDMECSQSRVNLFKSKVEMKTENLKSKCEVIEDVENISDTETSVVKFYVWTRGSIKLDGLTQKLLSAIQSALCDLVMENLSQIPLFEPTPTKKSAAVLNYSDPDCTESSTGKILSVLQSRSTTKTVDQQPSKTVPPKQQGHLSEAYHTILPDWLHYMKSNACISVSELTLNLHSRSCKLHCTQNLLKIFRSQITHPEIFLFSKPASSLVWTHHTGLGFEQEVPGKHLEMIICSENMWKRTVGRQSEQNRPNLSSIQRFPSHDISDKPEKSPCPQHSLIASSSFIPRHHFVYTLSKSPTTVTVYLYNIAGDKTASIHKTLKQCAAFHNARHTMMQGITFQKLGLFNYKNQSAEVSGFTVDVLSRYSSLPVPEKKQKPTFADRFFDDHYLDCQPVCPINERETSSKDKASLYGQQCYNIARLKYKRSEEKMHLKNLFAKFRKTAANVSIVSGPTLSILMSHARLLFAQCAPILLSCKAQKRFLAIYSGHKRKARTISGSKPEKLTRRSSFLDSYRRKSGDSLSKITTEKEEEHDTPDFNEEQLMNTFYQCYFNHWKGFVHLQTDISRAAKLSIPPTQYLYRAMPGGIVVITFLFHDDLFDVKLYGVDMPHMSYDGSRPDNVKLHVNFLNSCEKFKECLNVHAISLDLQLAEVQLLINDKVSSLYTGCSQTDILQALADCYEPLVHPLSHHILCGNVTVPCPNVSHKDMFSFITNHSEDMDLKVFYSNCKSLTTPRAMLCSTASLCDQHASNCSEVDHRNKNICVVFTSSASSNTRALVMDYYILFTEKAIQPTMANTPRNSSSSLDRKKHGRRFSEVTGIAQSLATFHREKLDLSSVVFNSTDKAESHQASCFVKCEQQRTEKCLAELCASAGTECYRHQLWNRLVQSCKEKNYSNSLSWEEFDKLQNLMWIVSASKIDPKVVKLLNSRKGSVKYGIKLHKRLLKAFPKSSASFVSGDSNVNTVCILNSDNFHVMVTVHVNMAMKRVSINMVRPVTTARDIPDSSVDSVAMKLLQEVLNEAYLDFWSVWW
uniref:Protein SZT2-like n=1 Tax=Phallusia mammillata TaxID=59560 RepID=A0A6F9DTL0_9ASCI|nr:protein SZT2-like [Phallusia mammillata]